MTKFNLIFCLLPSYGASEALKSEITGQQLHLKKLCFDTSNDIHLSLKQCLYDLCLTKKWFFYRTFQLMSAVVRLKGLVKVPLFCVKQRSCKHCLRNENLVQLNEYETAPYLFSTLVRSPAVRLRLVRCTAWVKRWSEAMDFLQLFSKIWQKNFTKTCNITL